MIPVTKPFLPPKNEYEQYLTGIWERNWLTNNGPLVKQLESDLKEYLGCKQLLFLTNGTVAIQIAIKALGLKGKIITTPFSYVATTSSIVWENCTPVFADIDPDTLNIAPGNIKKHISKQVSAILATHCFGNACDIDEITTIAKENNLKVIYDGAHCFGTNYKERSIFSYGDITTTSFHATKLFHSIEGGAVFSPDQELIKKMYKLRNFGHAGPEKFEGLGINGKNSEFHAAMGLCNLKYVDAILSKRKEQSDYYDKLLSSLALKKIKIQKHCEFNYAYYPIIFPSEKSATHVKANLEKSDIGTRRYFYPSLSKLDYVHSPKTPVSDDISKRILCLPLYHNLQPYEQEKVAMKVKNLMK